MTSLIVAAAQSASTRGNVGENVRTHLRLIDAAASAGVNLIVFPELSLTGYELDLAQKLQMEPDDPKLEPLRQAAARHEMHVLVGAPWASGREKPHLGAFLLSPERSVGYAKVHVHETEIDFFMPGTDTYVTSIGGVRVGVAICADTSHASHAEDNAERGAELYVASVLNDDAGYSIHAKRLEQYAARHAMAVLTANYADSTGGWESAGKSAFWDETGQLIVRAGSTGEALVVARREKDGWRGEVISDL